jgi:O-antigen ligase
VLFWGYLLTLPLPHTAALNNLFLYGSVLPLAVSLRRNELQWPRMDRAVLLLLAYAAIAVFGIFANQIDTANSLHRVRSDLLEQLYVLGFCLLYVGNRPSPARLLLPLAGGFLLLTLGMVVYVLLTLFQQPQVFSQDSYLRDVFPRYGLNAQFYLPILVGGLALGRLSHAGRWLLILAVAAAFVLAVWHNTTSAVVFVALHLLFVTLRHLRVRFQIGFAHLALFGLVAAIAVALSLKEAGFQKIMAQGALLSEGKHFELLSRRGGIWAIAIPCAKDAPWYGYGYGQKKVALICSEETYIRPARESGNVMADYFRRENYGKASFHNQYLENWFITGWLGALLWFAFFLGACHSAWRMRSADGLQQLVVLPSLLIFLAGCFFNGLWEGPAVAKGIMVILALALARRARLSGRNV